jgi:DNA-binding NarL/FixJ family response regulator
MSQVVIVGAGRNRARQITASLGDKQAKVVVKRWTSYLKAPQRRAKPDLIIYDLTGANAPSPEQLPELKARSRSSSVMYLTDENQSYLETLKPALAMPDTDFVFTSATPNELRLRTHLLLGRPSEEKTAEFARENETRATAARRGLAHLVPQLHNSGSGRLDANAISALFGISLTMLARALQRPLATIHKTPDAPALQKSLALYERIASALLHLTGSEEGLRIWMNAENPELDHEVPLRLLLEGEGDVVLDLLEDVLRGEPN